MKIFNLVILLLLSSAAFSNAQIYTDRDVKICKWILNYGVEKNLAVRPIGEIITAVGKNFLRTDYLAFGIEKEGEEQLVINLRGLDCTTFTENTLAISRLISRGDTTFDDFTKELTLIRYRDGKIDKYPSRLHYFSDWIYDNVQKNIVMDVTKDVGGSPVKFDLNFMSTNPKYYKHLIDEPDFIPVIREQEKEINQREYYFIPKNKVKDIEDRIKEGDIVAFTTSVKGLDIGHVGIAIKQKDRIYILHAPEIDEKVQITEKPLSEYIKSIKKHTGIIILRPLEPTTKSQELRTKN